ncbi:MAG TPA: hypothetical protein PLR99_06335 [Polyangiaceae bacterium]|nr:hypothetical protein [Polyangiaceae bacterium]
MLQALAGLIWLVGLAAYVITVIRAFKNSGVMWGLLSLCGPLGFYWGWANSGKLDAEAAAKGEKLMPPAKVTMIVWTVTWLLGGVVSRMAAD